VAMARADIVNDAVAKGDYGGTTYTSSASTVHVAVASATAQLVVTKTASPTSGVKSGDIITYTYTAQNAGNVTLSNISMVDTHNASGPAPIPANETLTAPGPLGASASSDDGTPNNGIWGSLAPGATVTFTATYTVRQADVDGLQ
jgi:large repetitive protein